MMSPPSANNSLTRLLVGLTRGFSKSAVEQRGTVTDYNDSHGVSVDIDGLWKGFAGRPVLQGIDLHIRAGEIFSILGPSGSGKSVLLKHLVKLIRPDRGRVLIDGQDVWNDTSEGSRGYRYSMVFQTSALFNSLTVGENVGLWLREKEVCPEARIREIIKEKLDLVGLAGEEERGIAELSGGMKKRVAIARSLAMNPDLILFDEPTAELDPITTDELAQVILDIRQRLDLTTVIVSHDLSFALHLSDRVAMIGEGTIIEVGTPEEIKASTNPDVKRFLYTTTKGIGGGGRE